MDEREEGVGAPSTYDEIDQTFTSGNELGPGEEISFNWQITKTVESIFHYTIEIFLYDDNGDSFPLFILIFS